MRSLLALAIVASGLVGFLSTAEARPATSYVSFQPQVRGMGCLQPKTRAMIAHITQRVGPIEITSTCGGRHAHNSQHYRGAAIDFRPKHASAATTLAALRSMPEVGGIGSYSGGLIHADVGARQASWHGHARHRVAHRHHGYGGRYASGRLPRRSGNG